ncbi:MULTISPECIES: hypothetical protein [Actinomadura]|uniref:Uncharacterized protein n=1 Tax=Actinomadura yumaensis TaxID=111807 RepID=A0ABW2CUX8_9ACTN|nr:hypothetical protein [Actinomadura sp. J1-007]MWK39593.1 hypothetical protein [Actinomadura sp. J1-007]
MIETKTEPTVPAEPAQTLAELTDVALCIQTGPRALHRRDTALTAAGVQQLGQAVDDVRAVPTTPLADVRTLVTITPGPATLVTTHTVIRADAWPGLLTLVAALEQQARPPLSVPAETA